MRPSPDDQRLPGAMLSGAVGIVLVPDPETQRTSRALAAELLGGRANFVLGQGDLPHLTLYHGTIFQAPKQSAAEIARLIAMQLVGKDFSLRSLGFAGGNFLFWDVDWSSDAAGLLRTAHENALSLAQFLDRRIPAKAVSEEGLKLSAEELRNIDRYGHPWVAELYRPHITLGFGPGLEEKVTLPRSCEVLRFSVSSVHLARIGFPGRVEEVLE